MNEGKQPQLKDIEDSIPWSLGWTGIDVVHGVTSRSDFFSACRFGGSSTQLKCVVAYDSSLPLNMPCVLQPDHGKWGSEVTPCGEVG